MSIGFWLVVVVRVPVNGRLVVLKFGEVLPGVVTDKGVCGKKNVSFRILKKYVVWGERLVTVIVCDLRAIGS